MPDTTERATLERWRELAGKERAGAPEALVWHTPEGIDVKPLYTRADVESLEFLDTLPGLFPFIRGPRATMPIVAGNAVGAMAMMGVSRRVRCRT